MTTQRKLEGSSEIKSRVPKVLAVVDSLGMGGAETWLMELLRYWSATGGVKLDFLITSGSPNIFDDEARDLGAKVHYLRYSRTSIRGFISEFRRILAVEAYDVIHDHQAYTSGWHFLFALGCLPRVRVGHLHTSFGGNISTNYNKGLLRTATSSLGKVLMQKLCTHICSTSRDLIHQYGFRCSQDSIPEVQVLHCGIDASKFAGTRDHDRHSVRREFGWPDDARIVLLVGRLDQELELSHETNSKNTWFALNIARKAKQARPTIRALIVGEGSSRERYQNAIAAWGLEHDFRLIGVRSDVARLMRSADLLLFPSREEGLGMAAVEAQAAGLPVLASTGVPVESVVIQNICVRIALDLPQDRWAAELCEIMDRPKPSPRYCAECVGSSTFTIQTSADALRKIYASALSG